MKLKNCCATIVAEHSAIRDQLRLRLVQDLKTWVTVCRVAHLSVFRGWSRWGASTPYVVAVWTRRDLKRQISALSRSTGHTIFLAHTDIQQPYEATDHVHDQITKSIFRYIQRPKSLLNSVSQNQRSLRT